MSTEYRLEIESMNRIVDEISIQGKWYYTTRGLYWELVRKNIIPEPKESVLSSQEDFYTKLKTFEAEHGVLPKRVQSHLINSHFNRSEVNSDLLTYAVRRLIIFQRPELYLMFALNQFYMRLECMLASASGLPTHIMDRVKKQVETGMQMDLFLVHDATPEGFAFAEREWKKWCDYENVQMQQSCLSFEQCKMSSIQVRQKALRTEEQDMIDQIQGPFLSDIERQNLKNGYFSQLEQVPPLRTMRMVYNRTVNRFDEFGFG